MQGEDERMPVKKSAHVCKVEGVGELDGVAGGGPHVNLVLRDQLRAVEVVLLGDEGKRSHEDVDVRVRDAGRGMSSSVRLRSPYGRRRKTHETVKFV